MKTEYALLRPCGTITGNMIADEVPPLWRERLPEISPQFRPKIVKREVGEWEEVSDDGDL